MKAKHGSLIIGGIVEFNHHIVHEWLMSLVIFDKIPNR